MASWSASSNKVTASTSGTPTTEVTNATYADLAFRVTCNIPTINNVAGIVLRQKVGSVTNYYLIKFKAGSSAVNFYKVVSGTPTLLSTSSVYKVPTAVDFNIEVHFEDGFMTFMINNNVILTKYDTTYTTGYYGFYAEEAVSFSNFQILFLYESVDSFTISSNDSLTNALSDALSLKGAYARINYLNQLAVIVPQSSDSSVYTYEGEIVSNGNTQSDTEEFNYIIVTGANGVTGSAIDTASIQAHNMQVRSQTITDQTLSTVEQCNTRASRELIINNRYRNQPEIVTPPIVGLELFDVVTIDDTISGVNTAYRVMNISTSYDVESVDYSQTIDLSNP